MNNNLEHNIDININVNIELIKNSLSEFNSSFETDFDTNTSNEIIENYFINEYKKLFSQYSNTNILFREKFNSKFYPYASVNIQI